MVVDDVQHHAQPQPVQPLHHLPGGSSTQAQPVSRQVPSQGLDQRALEAFLFFERTSLTQRSL